jgi:uncharacterized caspase-like protein
MRGAFLGRRGAPKTGLSAPIPRPACGGPAGFPLQSLARPRGRRAGICGTAILAAACVFLAACGQEVSLPAQYALVYGSDYQGSPVGPPLDFPDDDARAIADILASKGYAVTRQTNSGATSTQLETDIASLSATAEKDSTFVFYFSGHGHSIGGSEYIVFHNGVFVSDNDLMRIISRVPSRQKVLVIDACYSGGFIGDFPGVDTEGSSPISSAAEAFGKYFANTAAGDIAYTEAIVLAAAGASELSYEAGGYYNHGVFTYFLLQTPRRADANRDGLVTASEAYYFAKNAVADVWNSRNPAFSFYPHISGGAMDFVLFEAD